MSNTVPNHVPYLVLIVICIPLLISILFRKKKLGLISVFFTFVGMIYVFEYLILVVFQSYVYRPHFLSIPYYDNIIGALISDLITVPVIALLIAAFQLRFGWICLLALAFGGVEWLFIRLGVYRLYWWKISYTVVIFLLFFWLARRWYKQITTNYHPVLHFLSLFFISLTLVTTLLFTTAALHFHLDRTGFFQDPYRDNVLASVYGIVEASALALVQFFYRKNGWWNLSVPIFGLLFVFLLVRIQVIRILTAPGWFFGIVFVGSLLILALVNLLNRWLLQLMPPKSSLRGK